MAIVTQTAPRDWWNETDEVIATALAILDDHAAQAKRRR